MPPLLVVRVVTRLNVGGPTRQIASLMRHIPPDRFRQIVVTGRAADDEGDLLLDVPGERIVIDDLRRPIDPLSDRRAYRRLLAVFEELRPDVVHTHQAKAGLLGRLAARASGVRAIVHTYHGHTFRGYFRWPLATVLRALERRAASASSALIAQAEAQRDDLAEFLGPAARARTRIIPPGIEWPERPARPAPAGAPVRVVFPARLEPVKDPMLALAVAARLPAQFELHAFGDGSLRSAVAARIAADRALLGRVFLHPATALREEIFDGAAATLLASREEGTPLALIESQAFGVPVVAPDVGAIREIVGPGGGRVVAREEGSLAEAIQEAAKSRLDQAAIEWVSARFRAERLASDVAALYAEITSSDRA